jgi:hypothetical protein
MPQAAAENGAASVGDAGALAHCARLRAWANGLIQQAIAMMEEAADMRLRLWLERLEQLRAGAGRDAALERGSTRRSRSPRRTAPTSSSSTQDDTLWS